MNSGENIDQLTRENRTPDDGKPVRDSRGRWAKGTPSANPAGRKPLSAELPTLEGLKQGVTADRVAHILDELYTLATNVKAGAMQRVKAAELYLGYAVGKPAQSVNLNVETQTYDVQLPALPTASEMTTVQQFGEVYQSGVLSDNNA